MDARSAIDVRALSVRRSRVVLTPRCWRQVAQGSFLRGDGGKRAVHRGELEASRKAIAQGRPGCSRWTCMLVCRLLPCALARETAGAACTRSSLRPLIFEEGIEMQNFGRIAPRDREVVFVSAASMKIESVARMSEAKSGDGVGRIPGFRFAHPGYKNSAQRSCRVSLPCGAGGRAETFLAGVSPPVSAITETETTRSMIAWTSLRSHCPSDNFVSRSFSRMV